MAIANALNTNFAITLGGTLASAGAHTLSGAFASTFTFTGTTNVTFPTTGTLATVAGTVASITGTANQIAASASTGPVTLSLASTLIVPGTLTLNADPTSALQAATKQYVDATASGLSFKTPCVAASTANLNATYNNGSSGVGATLTNAGSLAAFTIDGVTPALNDRILVKNQTTAANNGIYTLTTIGSGSFAWVLIRATDYDAPSEIKPGDIVVVQTGTINGSTSWLQSAMVTTVGTSPITFTQFTYANPVTNVTATSPIASSGGATPNISLTGIVPVANGGSGTSTAFTSGSVLFAGSAGVYTQDNATFFWDDTNFRLGIGTNTPSVDLHVRKSATASSTNIICENTDATNTTSDSHMQLRTAVGGGNAFYIARTVGTGGNLWVWGIDQSDSNKWKLANGSTLSSSTAMTVATGGQVSFTNALQVTSGGTGINSCILGDTLYGSAANTLAKLPGNTAATTQYLSQTGTGSVSAAPIWAIINGGDINGAALTKTDDTNVTLTLGGAASSALLRATSLTLGWAGTLAVSRGGTGLSAATNSATLVSNGSGAPTWSSTMINGQLIIGSTGGTPAAARLTPANGVVITNAAASITVGLQSSIPGRNMVFNGGLNVWQRSNLITPTNYAYGPDRWQVGNNNGTSTFYQIFDSNTNSYLLRPQRNFGTSSTNTVVCATTLAANMCVLARNNVVTLSFTASSGATFSAVGSAMNVVLYSGTGSTDVSFLTTGFTGQTTAINTTQVLNASPTRYTFTSSVLGATVTQLGIQLSWVPTGTAGSGDYMQISDVQLEMGSVASNFEIISYTEELQRCQYFFQVVGGGAGYAANSSTAVQIAVTLLNTMRVTPTAVTTGAIVVTDGVANFTQGSPTVSNLLNGGTGGILSLPNYTGLTPFRPYLMNPAVNGNVINLDAEIY